jgi:hypothetical protein
MDNANVELGAGGRRLRAALAAVLMSDHVAELWLLDNNSA